ncbi:MAG TPA: transglycosylase SLT domain-containing protein [Pyrinomonadaceae bacterium]|jgi:membrane-bound lytic murein transglycosylase D
MTTSLPRLALRIGFVALLALSAVGVRAQLPAPSSLRSSTPTDIERDAGVVTQVIERAESHYKQGTLNLDDQKFEAARAEFDKAMDTLLESGLDVRAHPRLQTYYLQLVERIYRLEVPTALPAGQGIASAAPVKSAGGAQFVAVNGQTPQPDAPAQTGFLREQKFEPSPLDTLAKLELTEEEKKVTPEQTAEFEVAKSAVDFQFGSNALIQQFINYYQGRGRSTMETGLRRSGRFLTMARKIFREEGVPEDIAWLGQVESAWRPRAYSWAAASGLWQFIPGTGSRFGLRQTAWVDERNGYEKATRASARYLKFLANRYNGNWELAIGAYNTGEGNIDRAISRAGAANFWQIYPYIAQETRNYVPNILATILIAKNPEKYGFRSIRPDAPLAYDVVSVPSATSLQLIASMTETSVDYLRELNPELRRDITPRGEAYNVRVPPGRGRQFVALLKRVPADKREAAKVISVMPGEDMAAVAARTGVSVAQLQLWNAGADLKANEKLVVPANTVQRTIRPVRLNQQATGSALKTVRARAGQTIAQIAAQNGASAEEVARLNGIAADQPLAANQTIQVPAGKTAPAATTTATPQRVRRGR